MRILCWSELFSPYVGGIETLLLKLLPRLTARGFELQVVTSHAQSPLPDREERGGIPLYRFPFREAIERKNLQRMTDIRHQLVHLKRAFAPDIVHFHGIGPSTVFHFMTSNACPSRLLVSMHQETLRASELGGATLLERALRSADWVSAVSQTILDQGQRLVPEIAARSSVIYNGIDVPTVPPAPLPFDPPRLLCLGRIIRQKGFDTALRAFALVRNALPNVRLTIAGDGEKRVHLERLAVRLRLQEAVTFTGWVPPEEIPALLNEHTLMLMPSRWEGLGLTAIEAAIMARPVIATAVGGLSEVVRHRETGLRVELDAAPNLANAAVSLLQQPQWARQLGQQARRAALQRFNFEQCVQRYAELYARWAHAESARYKHAKEPMMP